MITKNALLIGLLALSSQFSLAGVNTPETLEGCKKITATEAKTLFDSGTPIFDVRVANEFAEDHIKVGDKEAVSLPYSEKSKKEATFDASLDKFDDSKLPASNMIFQCNGADCWKSYKACAWAHKKGKKDLYWFRGGLPEWKDNKFPHTGK